MKSRTKDTKSSCAPPVMVPQQRGQMAVIHQRMLTNLSWEFLGTMRMLMRSGRVNGFPPRRNGNLPLQAPMAELIPGEVIGGGTWQMLPAEAPRWPMLDHTKACLLTVRTTWS